MGCLAHTDLPSPRPVYDGPALAGRLKSDAKLLGNPRPSVDDVGVSGQSRWHMLRRTCLGATGFEHQVMAEGGQQ